MRFVKILLAFLIAFNFPIPIVYNSMMLSIIIASIIYFNNIKLLNNVFKIFKLKNVFNIILVFFFVIIMGLIPGVLHLTFDFSILKGNILTFILVLTAIYIYPILKYNVSNKDLFFEIIKIVIGIFFIQSIIEILAFSNENVKGIVTFFQKEAVSAKDMGGIRALGLTGNPFFDLAAAFGLVFILFSQYILMENKGFFTIKNSLIFLLLFVGSFFAGRTAFIGLGLSLILYFLSVGKKREKILSFFSLLIATACIAYLLYFTILSDDIKEVVENQLLPFVFEAVYNYIEDGSTSTSSGEVLDNMYFPISFITFLFGDGRYTGADGAYYLHTDAGIMRNILFYGIFGLLATVIGSLVFFIKPLRILINSLRYKAKKSDVNSLLFFLIVILYTVTIHYKGEVLLFMPIIQIILFWITCAFVESKSEDLNHE